MNDNNNKLEEEDILIATTNIKMVKFVCQAVMTVSYLVIVYRLTLHFENPKLLWLLIGSIVFCS